MVVGVVVVVGDVLVVGVVLLYVSTVNGSYCSAFTVSMFVVPCSLHRVRSSGASESSSCSGAFQTCSSRAPAAFRAWRGCIHLRRRRAALAPPCTAAHIFHSSSGSPALLHLTHVVSTVEYLDKPMHMRPELAATRRLSTLVADSSGPAGSRGTLKLCTTPSSYPTPPLAPLSSSWHPSDSSATPT